MTRQQERALVRKKAKLIDKINRGTHPDPRKLKPGQKLTAYAKEVVALLGLEGFGK